MKQISLLLFSMCMSVITFAQKTTSDDQTTDKIKVSEITLAPGGEEGFFTVSLEGNTIYTAFGMDLFLPEGYEVSYLKNNKMKIRMANNKGSLDGNDIYPFTEDEWDGTKTYTHTLSFSNPSHQQIRLACISTQNDEFTKTSGALFHVYVKATPYAKPGKSEIRVEGVELVVRKDAKPYHPENTSYPIYATNNSSVNINIAAENKFSTCILPFDCQVPAGTTAYTCNEVDSANHFVKLTKEKDLKAYTPYILYAENGCTTTVSGTVDESKYVTSATYGKLTGVIVLTELQKGYVLQNQGKGTKFYRTNPKAPFSLRAGRCYLNIPSTATTNIYNIDITPTGITEISQENKTAKAMIYDLQGHRVYYPAPGHIYIVNGNKMLMK